MGWATPQLELRVAGRLGARTHDPDSLATSRRRHLVDHGRLADAGLPDDNHYRLFPPAQQAIDARPHIYTAVAQFRSIFPTGVVCREALERLFSLLDVGTVLATWRCLFPTGTISKAPRCHPNR